MSDIVSIRVPGVMKYIHFMSDSAELLVKSRITFESEVSKAKFVQDLRILMYELFSNAVNHTQSEFIQYTFDIKADVLHVIVVTNNSGFGIKPVTEFIPGTDQHPIYFPPYDESMIGEGYIVYRDSEDKVICTVKSSSELYFHHQKNTPEESEQAEIPEHYGLNLITRLSQTTKYQRNESGEDEFIITIKFE